MPFRRIRRVLTDIVISMSANWVSVCQLQFQLHKQSCVTVRKIWHIWRKRRGRNVHFRWKNEGLWDCRAQTWRPDQLHTTVEQHSDQNSNFQIPPLLGMEHEPCLVTIHNSNERNTCDDVYLVPKKRISSPPPISSDRTCCSRQTTQAHHYGSFHSANHNSYDAESRARGTHTTRRLYTC